MTRYWFAFDIKQGDENIAPGITIGCGVTAHNYDDALFLVQQKLFKNRALPGFTFIENIDVSTLDAGHVLPNMYPANVRGIWFPAGFNY